MIVEFNSIITNTKTLYSEIDNILNINSNIKNVLVLYSYLDIG